MRRAEPASGSHRASSEYGCTVLRQPTNGGRNDSSSPGLM